MMIEAKLCAHFASVCLRAVEQEDDPNYRAMLLELAAEWLIDAQRSYEASTRQRGKRGRARLSRRSPKDIGKSGRLLTAPPPSEKSNAR
jgi:hypothetical protein